MSTFHKSKVFRSTVGCCICRAKSSSSRFTESSRYEDQFQTCFKLEEERIGEICNACVLLVKRWKKLPKNTKKNWAHVVDARAGPGAKNFAKQKKTEEKSEEFEKIRRKHVYRKKSRSIINESTSRTQASMSSCLSAVDFGGAKSAKRTEENQVSDFFDSSYWKQELICCGVIFRGLLREVMVDPRLYKRCSLTTHGPVIAEPPPLTVVESLIESELRKFTENNTEVKVKDIDSDSDIRSDEGFCDKASILTGPSSPDSCTLFLEED
eukprot:GFUD01072649.1.p1 GENE.GFUD01072649.1~~GFUD01072649.1.p1  ORF type:complete len:267 (-),score=52.59 GFUD01072649.1:28-828(-)